MKNKNILKLTYAGVPESLKEVGLDPETLGSSNPRLSFLCAGLSVHTPV